MNESADIRAALRQIFGHALAECSIQKVFARHVHYDRGVLRIMEDLYGLPAYNNIFVVSIGKAAHTMSEALAAQLGKRMRGIVVGSTQPKTMLHGFTYFTGGHPLPTAESVRAAGAVLRAL